MTQEQIKEVERRFIADDKDFPEFELMKINMSKLENNNLGDLNYNLKFLNRIINLNKEN